VRRIGIATATAAPDRAQPPEQAQPDEREIVATVNRSGSSTSASRPWWAGTFPEIEPRAEHRDRRSSGAILAFADDEALLPPDWLTTLQDAMDRWAADVPGARGA